MDWYRARVLPLCAGWHGDRTKTSWGLVGREVGGVRVGVGSRVTGVILRGAIPV